MLVLLIIFMVAAPLSTVDIAVDLPVSTAKPQPRPDKPLFLTIKADYSLALGNDRHSRRRRLASAIDAATQRDRQKRIFLRADKTVPYGELMRVMNLLRPPAISRWRWSASRASTTGALDARARPPRRPAARPVAAADDAPAHTPGTASIADRPLGGAAVLVLPCTSAAPPLALMHWQEDERPRTPPAPSRWSWRRCPPPRRRIRPTSRTGR